MNEFVNERLVRVHDWLRIATDDTNGRGESDPVYKAITENRDTGQAYSSCGDLCHWLLYRLGIRSPYINRAEHLGWRTGMNIGYLMWKCPEARAPRHGEQFTPGDILAIWNRQDGTDAHVLVVREQKGPFIASTDYGQPGGAMKTRVLDRYGRLGDRKLQRIVPVVAAIEGAQRRGEMVAADDPLGWLARLSSSGVQNAEPPVLRRGASGPWVKRLQKLLGDLVVDGNFGPMTERAVRSFQWDRELVVDGVVGRLTWKALGQ